MTVYLAYTRCFLLIETLKIIYKFELVSNLFLRVLSAFVSILLTYERDIFIFFATEFCVIGFLPLSPYRIMIICFSRSSSSSLINWASLLLLNFISSSSIMLSSTDIISSRVRGLPSLSVSIVSFKEMS